MSSTVELLPCIRFISGEPEIVSPGESGESENLDQDALNFSIYL